MYFLLFLQTLDQMRPSAAYRYAQRNTKCHVLPSSLHPGCSNLIRRGTTLFTAAARRFSCQTNCVKKGNIQLQLFLSFDARWGKILFWGKIDFQPICLAGLLFIYFCSSEIWLSDSAPKPSTTLSVCLQARLSEVEKWPTWLHFCGVIWKSPTRFSCLSRAASRELQSGPSQK